MATVYRENRATPARQYISTAAFDTYFFTYTVTTDPNTFVQSGSFATVTGANATNCPRGRILRETGERLYPGQSNVNTLMVKVLDSNSCLSGYIDPNAEVFALYNADKPPSATDGFENNATSGVHKGPSLYTAGNIIADGGSLRVTGTADVSGEIVSQGQLRSSTVTALTPGATVNINPALGQIFTLAQGSGVAVTLTCSASPPVGAMVYLIVTQAGTAAAIGQGTRVKMASVTPTNGKTTTIAFISDGTNINMFGQAISA
jgi:hypothetical protein